MRISLSLRSVNYVMSPKKSIHHLGTLGYCERGLTTVIAASPTASSNANTIAMGPPITLTHL